MAAPTDLRVAACGLPSILLLAGAGVLRELQDTRTPLRVVIAANLANIGLNLLLVQGFGLGVAGSALGTLIAQTGAAVVVATVVVRRTRVMARRMVRWGCWPASRSGCSSGSRGRCTSGSSPTTP